MKKLISLCLMLLMVMAMVTACGDKETPSSSDNPSSDAGNTGSSTENDEVHGETCEATGCVWDAYTPYEETITFTKGATKASGGEGYPEGDSITNNDYTRYVLEQMNIQTALAWETDANNYDQKVSLSIAAGDIPDVMFVDRRIFRQLIENDLIWDMTDAYEKCISPFLRGEYESHPARLFDEVSVDGRIMGLPSTNLAYQNYQVVWVREDWLKAVGMEPPTTMDEIADVARAFIEQDPGGNGAGKTIGFTTNENVYDGLKNVFFSMESYPQHWIEVDGQIEYGSIQPETKEALALLRDLYAEGLIDKEFAVRQTADRDELIASGKLGIIFGFWYQGVIGDCVVNNPDADWIAVDGPLNSDGKIIVPEGDPLNDIMVVSKSFEHPEAIVKTLNATFDMIRANEGPGKEASDALLENSPGMGWWVCSTPLLIDQWEGIKDVSLDLINAVELDDKDALEHKAFANAYDLIINEQENPKQNPGSYNEVQARLQGGIITSSDAKEFKEIPFFGKTEGMDTKWANLEKLETETFLKIVMGEKPLDEFDNFVENWKKMGGDEITQEVREAVS